MPDLSPNAAAVLTLAKERMEQIETPQQLVWED